MGKKNKKTANKAPAPHAAAVNGQKDETTAQDVSAWKALIPEEKVALAVDSSKGRVLLANRSYEVGETIFTDTAFVHANWYEFKCLECDAPHDSKTCAVVQEK